MKRVETLHLTLAFRLLSLPVALIALLLWSEYLSFDDCAQMSDQPPHLSFEEDVVFYADSRHSLAAIEKGLGKKAILNTETEGRDALNWFPMERHEFLPFLPLLTEGDRVSNLACWIRPHMEEDHQLIGIYNLASGKRGIFFARLLPMD
jgi:hypothetical protein